LTVGLNLTHFCSLFKQSKKPAASKKSKKKAFSDSDEDYEDDEVAAVPIEPISRTGRARKVINYNFDTSDEEDE